MQSCRICSHPERNLINRAIEQGTSLGILAARFEVTHDGLSRHREAHIEKVNIQDAGVDPNQLLMDLKVTKEAAEQMLRTSLDDDIKLKAMSEMRRCTESIAKLTNAFKAMNNQVVQMVWSRVKSVVLDAVHDDPKIRERILLGLERIQSEFNG